MVSTQTALTFAAAAIVLVTVGVGCFMARPSSSTRTTSSPAPQSAVQPVAAERAKLPAVDRSAPAEVATATFAMG